MNIGQNEAVVDLSYVYGSSAPASHFLGYASSLARKEQRTMSGVGGDHEESGVHPERRRLRPARGPRSRGILAAVLHARALRRWRLHFAPGRGGEPASSCPSGRVCLGRGDAFSWLMLR
jgi:hypothetical protein